MMMGPKNYFYSRIYIMKWFDPNNLVNKNPLLANYNMIY